jgi:hypothetical protein
MHVLNFILLVSAGVLISACWSIVSHIKQHKKKQSAEKAVRASP